MVWINAGIYQPKDQPYDNIMQHQQKDLEPGLLINRRQNKTKPEGQVTRGKTAPNRLRSADAFLAAYDPALLTKNEGLYRNSFYVDLGYGAEPTTTLESARRLRRLNPRLPVLGIEIKPERVERALPFANKNTFFRLGGFNFPLATWPDGTPETVRLVRAFNVLRQYEEDEVLPAYKAVMDQILPGGLMMDGTSDPYGRIWTASLLRKSSASEGSNGWSLEALVLGANLRLSLDMDAFQTRLPKSFIHQMIPGQPVFSFMEAFKAAARDTRSHEVWGPRSWFMATGRALQSQGYDIMRYDKWLRRGWLVWRNPDLG
jgi:hypothetical protein